MTLPYSGDGDLVMRFKHEIAKLKADQSDWRKGVDLIRVSLGDPDPNLSCVRLAEIALALRAGNERIKSELIKARSHVQALLSDCEDMPHRLSVIDASEWMAKNED